VRDEKEKILLGKGEEKRSFFPEEISNANIGFHFGLLSPKKQKSLHPLRDEGFLYRTRTPRYHPELSKKSYTLDHSNAITG